VHGQKRKHHHTVLGLNGRLDTLQAAMLLPAFDVFQDEIQRRQMVATRYTGLLSAVLSSSALPYVPNQSTSVFTQYTMVVEGRESIQANLKSAGIPSVSYYTIPLHLQPVFQCLNYQSGDFPVTEQIASQCFSIPMSPYLTNDEQQSVVNAIIL
jgi:UDP-2-acetamido-2-deoxy-ribo-hexuluronate aminotransferase